jgi:hypothetical protein
VASRDSDIRAVVTQLDEILAALAANVAELSGILTGPTEGGEANERLIES